MQVDFLDQTNSISSGYFDDLKQLVLFVGREEKVPSQGEVSITFVNKEEIRELNRTYRKIDESTDVLSFAMHDFVEDELNIIRNDRPIVLGDIIICVDTAKEQAINYNHTIKRELGFLIVHGFLHLLGYDHITELDEKKMFDIQTHLLKEFGLER